MMIKTTYPFYSCNYLTFLKELDELDHVALEDKEMKELVQEERVKYQQELNDMKVSILFGGAFFCHKL